MSPTLLLHTDQAIDAAGRIALNERLQAALGRDTRLEQSRKPHLLFVSLDFRQTTPRQLLAAIRAQGVVARVVDL